MRDLRTELSLRMDGSSNKSYLKKGIPNWSIQRNHIFEVNTDEQLRYREYNLYEELPIIESKEMEEQIQQYIDSLEPAKGK